MLALCLSGQRKGAMPNRTKPLFPYPGVEGAVNIGCDRRAQGSPTVLQRQTRVGGFGTDSCSVAPG